MLDQHPHAAAVLGAALDGRPAHAYLLHGPAGTGKRAAARDFAAALLAGDSESARARVQHGTHPDLTWVAPSGAHEMLRRDVQESVVSAASHTPFESSHRVFVLERADTMNDEAANALLKTLEEPPPYVVLLLLTDNPSQVLPTIGSRCQPVRFDPLPAAELAERLQAARDRPRDGDRLRAAVARRRRESLDAGADARAARPHRGLRARADPRPRARRPGLAAAADAGARARAPPPRRRSRPRSPKRSSTCPRRSTASARPSSPTAPAGQSAAPPRARSSTRSSSSASGTATSPAWRPGPRSWSTTAIGSTRCGRTPPSARRRLARAVAAVDDTRAALSLNVSEELALEALAYRLEIR